MNERQLFESALEMADPQARQAFLDKACRGDAALRAKVDALLKSHATAGSFLDIPAADQLGPGTDNGTTDTIVGATGDDSAAEWASGEAEFRKYLQPATRPGWLGRLGHYEIEAILGRGAFGIVAKAFDEKLHRVVAIKLMNPELATTSPPRQRFLREARTAAAVTHENIVAIHAVEEEPIPYLVMEYIPGQTLQQRMDAKGPFDAKEILRIGQQVAAGLAAAHGANLIHRDIKPSNILLAGGPAERAKISDFGLARAVDDASMTQSGMIAGTPLYMAPEQARGETLDHRADLFSLGSVLYQLASGRPPFRAASTVAVLKRVCEDTPRPLDDVIPGIPGWLETVIFKLLEKKRDDRYQTAQELADLLARCQSELQHQGQVTCVQGSPRTAETQDVPPARAADRRAKRKPIGWLIGGVLAVAAVMGFALINGGKKTPDPDTTSPSTTTTSPSPTKATALESPESIGWHGWPTDAPAPAIAPFDAEQAKQHQEAWAAYLKIPVEYTNSIGMKFMLIPPGEFTMGSTAEEIAAALKDVSEDQHWQECIQSEAPQHKVILTQPIYLGMNEVTQAEYEQVMGVNPSHFAPMGMGKEAVAGLETAEHPVEMVSWNDAAEFCAKLSKQEKLKPFYFRTGETITPLDGTGYRLPSEAEWEFACRAGTATKYWIGDKDEDLVRAGWFGGNAGARTHAAGELKANPFGLSDIHGNVWEWVQDGWDASYYGQLPEKPAINSSSPFFAGSQHVLRGGYWSLTASYCRSSLRFAYDPTHRSLNIGFRVSLVVDAVRQALKVTGPGMPKSAATTPLAPASSPIDFAAELAAAEWVLANKGTMSIAVSPDWQWRDYGATDNEKPLPSEPFVITALFIKNSQVKTESDLERLTRCRYLETLGIGGGTIDSPAIELLTRLPRLKSLTLIDQKNLRTSDLPKLGQISSLDYLSINSDMVDDRLDFVRHLPALRTLKIWGTQPPDITLLAEAPQLRTILLTTPDAVDDDKLAAVQARLGQSRIVVGWKGKYRTVGRDPAHEAAKQLVELGVECLGGVNYWQPCTKLLTKADFEDGSIWSFSVQKIPASVQLSADDREKLALLDSYHFVAEGQRESDELAKCLSGNHGIASITMTDCDLTDVGLEDLQKLVSLRHINVSKTNVTPAAIERFHRGVPYCWITSDFGVTRPKFMSADAAKRK